MNEKVKQLKVFIYDYYFQNKLMKINNNFIDYNILEITGMGHQETKHSNILGWLFDDTEHNFKYKIFDEFLKKIILKNKNNEKIEELKKYIEINKYNLEIHREKDNIDLLIVDKKNKVVIAIENKIYAKERKNGDDGGQLNKYENIINDKYDKTYSKFFIFLTIDLEQPSQGNENWMIANHQMVTDIIEEILKDKLSIRTEMIFESYVDLLKKRNIVKDTKLDKICNKMWVDYKTELNLIHGELENDGLKNIVIDPKLLNSLKILVKYKPLLSIKDLDIENELLKILISKIDDRLKDKIGIVQPNVRQFYIKNNITKITFVWIEKNKNNISMNFNQLKTPKLNDEEKAFILNKYNNIGKFTNREFIVKIKDENELNEDLLKLIEDEMNNSTRVGIDDE